LRYSFTSHSDKLRRNGQTHDIFRSRVLFPQAGKVDRRVKLELKGESMKIGLMLDASGSMPRDIRYGFMDLAEDLEVTTGAHRGEMAFVAADHAVEFPDQSWGATLSDYFQYLGELDSGVRPTSGGGGSPHLKTFWEAWGACGEPDRFVVLTDGQIAWPKPGETAIVDGKERSGLPPGTMVVLAEEDGEAGTIAKLVPAGVPILNLWDADLSTKIEVELFRSVADRSL
jgi:hypothetical protein